MHRPPLPLPLAIALAACLAACTARVEFSIDNPTAAPLRVAIDGEAQEVPAHAARGVKLAPGRHTLEAAPVGKLDFLVYSGGRGGLINPSLAPYVVASAIYATSDQTAKGFRPWETDVVLDGVTVHGPFRVLEGLFIDRSWQFGAQEPFPESIRVGRDAKGNIQGKLFRREDFIAAWEQAEERPGWFEAHRAPAPAVRRPDALPALPTFADAALEAKAAVLKDLVRRYARTEKAGEQESLRKAYHQATIDALQAYAPLASKQPAAENEKWNALVKQGGEEMGRSARVLE